MAKAQPAMSITFDISKKQLNSLVDTLGDFNDHSMYLITDVDYKKANVSGKELKARLLEDKVLKGQIRNSIEDIVNTHIADIIDNPYHYDVGCDIGYLETQMEAVEVAAKDRHAAERASADVEAIANNIKAAVDLLKKAGYKVSG